MPAVPIIIQASNLVQGTLNQFRYSFPNSTDLNDYQCSIASSFLYYSWYNISSALRNNTFQLIVPTGAGSTTYTIVLPDGAYNITTLNQYLQYWFISQNLYITNNTTGLNTYYASFQLSSQSYQVQFISTAMPTSTPSGYTNAGITWPTTGQQAIQLTVSSTNTFSQIIGFSAGTYPASPTITGSTYTYASDLVPNVNPLNTIQMRLSCLNNLLSTNNTLLHVFNNKGASIGSLIDVSPLNYNWIPCQGITTDITLGFYNPDGSPLQLLDPNITIKLLFKKKDEIDN